MSCARYLYVHLRNEKRHSFNNKINEQIVQLSAEIISCTCLPGQMVLNMNLLGSKLRARLLQGSVTRCTVRWQIDSPGNTAIPFQMLIAS